WSAGNAGCPNPSFRQRWPFGSPLSEGAENIHATLAQLCICDCLAHQVRNDRALVLSSERLVELRFDVIWDTEIDGGHVLKSIVEEFNNTNRIAISATVKARKNSGKSAKSQASCKCLIILMLIRTCGS